MKKITSMMKNSMKLQLFICIVMLTMQGFAQDESTFVRKTYTPEGPVCVMMESDYQGTSSTLRSPELQARMLSRGNQCSTFVVSYNGFTPDAQAAFQFAVDIWAASIESPVPINISANFSALGAGVLGSAGAVNYQTTNAAEAMPNVFYPKALVEKLEGMDTSPFGGSNDINANFSNQANWYYGTDGNTPSGQFDFVSVVLHELGHGLGFAGFADVQASFPDDIGSIRFNGNPSIYDIYIENGTGDAILSFADPSAALGAELEGNDLFCNGPIAVGQLSGTLPRIFAPASWNGGSSYSHWNENTFLAGDINSLMTPQIGPGEAMHDPGPITLGFFEDMGWSICGGSLTVEEFDVDAITVSPNPFTSNLEIRLASGFNDDYSIDFYDINGRVILSKTDVAVDGSISVSGLSTLQDALYFVKITNKTLATSVTKKLMKR